MTDKERLEEMNRMKRHAIEHDDKPMLLIIEQAERVQELEEENCKLNGEVDGLLLKLEDREPYYSMKCIELEERNKRYREAIENALEELNNSPRLSLEGLEAMEILGDALEGEE